MDAVRHVVEANVGHPSALAIVGADGDPESRLHTGKHGDERELADEDRIGQVLAGWVCVRRGIASGSGTPEAQRPGLLSMRLRCAASWSRTRRDRAEVDRQRRQELQHWRQLPGHTREARRGCCPGVALFQPNCPLTLPSAKLSKFVVTLSARCDPTWEQCDGAGGGEHPHDRPTPHRGNGQWCQHGAHRPPPLETGRDGPRKAASSCNALTRA